MADVLALVAGGRPATTAVLQVTDIMRVSYRRIVSGLAKVSAVLKVNSTLCVCPLKEKKIVLLDAINAI